MEQKTTQILPQAARYELEVVLDTFTKHAERNLIGKRPNEITGPLVAGFTFENQDRVFAYPLQSESPAIVWESAFLQDLGYSQVYSALKSEGLSNLILVFPGMATKVLDATLLSKKLGKKIEELTTHDLKVARTKYPQAVELRRCLQYFIDMGGDMDHAYAEVSPNNVISEYTVSEKTKPNSTLIKMATIRQDVFST